ncbi:hypothetical protein QP919_05650 [Corynebacterium propinquum]|uniref:Uncharacterized protein n=1 Tax=Corynebacterium propinquum TaxID=43769 RepID=A0AAP4F6D3_9CORY|nr:hypothetical protein [Corynebacterium propinquum]MDK4303147.1 hypothetical protein [Corynebacterium propinquum]MDK4325912.1 hypothetical protein [Corynebacterium propinquum]MDK8722879.1 hypothetical protein [Corynebacterium propinquum]UQV59766.1 hypothetical protein L9H28_08180 [Corynebacterium propinquum]WKS27900.1 hypothetical protein NLL49_01155 [Corynebacterium propinquum]
MDDALITSTSLAGGTLTGVTQMLVSLSPWLQMPIVVVVAGVVAAVLATVIVRGLNFVLTAWLSLRDNARDKPEAKAQDSQSTTQ